MRTADFWGWIERFPWLFRYFYLRSTYDDVPDELLGSLLAHEIPRSVRWIAIRPFNKRTLQMKRSQKNQDDPLVDARRVTKDHIIETQTMIFVQWSSVRDESRHTHWDAIELDVSVGDHIESLRAKLGSELTIDAIVRTTYRRAHELIPGSQRRIGKFDENGTVSFDIYLV